MKPIPKLPAIHTALIDLMIAAEDSLRANPRCYCHSLKRLTPDRDCSRCRLVKAMEIVERETGVIAVIPPIQKPQSPLAVGGES